MNGTEIDMNGGETSRNNNNVCMIDEPRKWLVDCGHMNFGYDIYVTISFAFCFHKNSHLAYITFILINFGVVHSIRIHLIKNQFHISKQYGSFGQKKKKTIWIH